MSPAETNRKDEQPGQRAAFRPRKTDRCYQESVRRQIAFHAPPRLRVLEIGWGLGDLLAAVQPAYGLGIDFSPEVVKLARPRHSHIEFQAAGIFCGASATSERAWDTLFNLTPIGVKTAATSAASIKRLAWVLVNCHVWRQYSSKTPK